MCGTIWTTGYEPGTIWTWWTQLFSSRFATKWTGRMLGQPGSQDHPGPMRPGGYGPSGPRIFSSSSSRTASGPGGRHGLERAQGPMSEDLVTPEGYGPGSQVRIWKLLS
ncbi:hypothetical protein AVEN_121538-1 [Araneus ventricosus]|uniref:Uncharacterized protein n=1 Tax=Araneus ventricosus TaxID=182803 RepID=A0A4Y2GPG0_ARAVE|nr:hypothetical protein AVEN_121538-1 [Araneus ventricosus]